MKYLILIAVISAKPYVYTNWAKEIDKETGRPIETDFARYPDMNAQIVPSPGGGHNWQPMAYNSKTGLVYIPAREEAAILGQPVNWEYNEDPRAWNTALGFNPDNPIYRDSLANGSFGKLIAWNPRTQKEAWSVWQKSSWNAGVLTTDDLVFQGNAEGELAAYDATKGTKLWSYQLNTGIIAPPVTYEIDGTQYLSILVGWGGIVGLWTKFTKHINTGTLYTFALGKKVGMPDFPEAPAQTLIDLDFQATPGQIQKGGQLFNHYCNNCHGGPMGLGQGGGSIPDLTYSSTGTFEAFQQIVGHGALIELGMPNFGDRLTPGNIEDIKNYILSQAKSKRDQLLKQ